MDERSLDHSSVIPSDTSKRSNDHSSILADMFDIVELKTNNFKLYEPTNSTDLCAKYKLIHKTYKLILPHELYNLQTDISEFLARYQRRIIRFNQLKKSSKKIVFIRLGLKSEIIYLDSLDKLLKTEFGMNTRLIFIDSTKYHTSSWHRNEINWLELLNIS